MGLLMCIIFGAFWPGCSASQQAPGFANAAPWGYHQPIGIIPGQGVVTEPRHRR